ncbi:MAG: FliH/SctL family protein [Acidobacteriota bacterium]|nr:FliH/SctL family protein [Acidobacteriota bacterium]
MLSKVLNRGDGGRAQPALFTSVAARTPTAGGSLPDRRDPAAGEQLRAALERVRDLETQSPAAQRDAFEAGRRQGEQQARLELAPVLERLNSSVAEIIGMRSGIRRSVEKDAVQLSLLIARRVLHRELSVDPSALTALARVVFERLARTESYRIVLHPQFAEAIRSALPGNQLSRVQIDADPSVAPGTLVVHSEEGLIDASVDAQLEEISRGLTDRLANT